MTHNLDATVFVYRSKKTGCVRCEYAEVARTLSENDWEHEATLEPRMWIEYHWDEVKGARK